MSGGCNRSIGGAALSSRSHGCRIRRRGRRCGSGRSRHRARLGGCSCRHESYRLPAHLNGFGGLPRTGGRPSESGRDGRCSLSWEQQQSSPVCACVPQNGRQLVCAAAAGWLAALWGRGGKAKRPQRPKPPTAMQPAAGAQRVHTPFEQHSTTTHKREVQKARSHAASAQATALTRCGRAFGAARQRRRSHGSAVHCFKPCGSGSGSGSRRRRGTATQEEPLRRCANWDTGVRCVCSCSRCSCSRRPCTASAPHPAGRAAGTGR